MKSRLIFWNRTKLEQIWYNFVKILINRIRIQKITKINIIIEFIGNVQFSTNPSHCNTFPCIRHSATILPNCDYEIFDSKFYSNYQQVRCTIPNNYIYFKTYSSKTVIKYPTQYFVSNIFSYFKFLKFRFSQHF